MLTAQPAESNQKLPHINGKPAVATVNNEAITLEEFNEVLKSIEHDHMETGGSAEKIDYTGILNRMIDEKLFLAEARNIGLHQLPEVKRSINENSVKILTKLLVRKELRDVEADMEEVDELYKEATRELKVTSLLFEDEDKAKAAAGELESGKDFDEIVKDLTKEGEIKEVLEGTYLKRRELWPEVVKITDDMETGSVSPVIPINQGYLILRLEDIRYTEENEKIKESLIRRSLKKQREKALYEYSDALIEKYVKVDDDILNSIDYDTSVENFETLMKDTRVLATIKGSDPVTVAELSESFKESFYHGVEDHIKRKRLNDKKEELLEELLQKKVFLMEAKKQGLDKTASYKKKLENFENSLLLGLFIQKVITPGIKFTEEELKTYFEENAEEYTYPRMDKIWSLAFHTMEDAKSAIAKLRKGSDFKWLSANAENQVPEDSKGLLTFNGNILSHDNLPQDIRGLLDDITIEDYRLYSSPEGYYYVLYVQDIYPSGQKNYEEVKKELAEQVYNDKISKELKEWSDKLKEHYKVEIYFKSF